MTSAHRYPSPGQVAHALASREWHEMPALPGRTNHLRAGVMIPIRWEPEPLAVCTLRAAHLGLHAGEVCFPGGSQEPGDESLFATASREAAEELGIEDARLLGRLSSVPVFTSDFRLEPFVAEIGAAELRPNPGEVAEVLGIPIRDVLEGAQIDGIPYLLTDVKGLAPVFRVDEHWMFGATAYAMLELVTVMAPLYRLSLPPLRDCGLRWPDVLPELANAEADR